ncbi:hypothetical protein ACFQYP_61760 [Nonomuraea antimicrobica]
MGDVDYRLSSDMWRADFVLGDESAVTWAADGRLTGWDLHTLRPRWRRTAQEDCVAATGPEDAVRPVMLGDVVVTLARCGPGASGAGGSGARVQVLGLDPRTGAEVWRHGLPGVSASGPAVTPSRDGRALWVTWPEEGETAGVILSQDGRVVADGDHATADDTFFTSRGYLADGPPETGTATGTGQVADTGLVADAELVADGGRASGGWRSFPDGREGLPPALPAQSRDWAVSRLPLERALVTAQEVATVQVTPWDGGPAARVPLGFAAPESSETASTALTPAPGAIVATTTHDTMVVGLV